VKRHPPERPFGPDLVFTAAQEHCPDCHRELIIYQVDSRRVQGLEYAYWLKRRDRRCRKDCPGERPIILAPRDLRVALPGRIYGLDVTLHVGERHLGEGKALAQITRDLNARGLPIDQRHTGRVFRDFLALTRLARGDDEALKARLRAQGGIVLMCDGVQFDERSPVLYLVWDALSGQPLFGERKLYRGQQDLVPLLEQVRELDVPIIGAVTDKEKGLVPAVEEVFPGTPYQFCHTHFLKNCARPLKEDSTALGASVRRRAEAVRKLGKGLSAPSEPSPPAPERRSAPPEPVNPETAVGAEDVRFEPLDERELAQEVCELVRVNSRVSGKAPLAPPELERHERLESIRAFVEEAKKKPRPRRTPRGGLCSRS
jgi:hypothetical protein